MKKLLYVLVFILALNFIPMNISNAESVMEPQWSEFCPPLYENAVFKKAKENSKKYMENNYWALRRAKFQKAIAECKAYAGSQSELNSCYMRVANIEKNKTNQKSLAKSEHNEDLDREIIDDNNATRHYGYGYYYSPYYYRY